MTRIALRADASSVIGFGHLVRCRALAEAFQALGCTITWACRADSQVSRILGRDADLVLSGIPSFAPLGVDEADRVGAWARGAAWLVCDHYSIDRTYVDRLRAAAPGIRVLLIDDHQLRDGADLRLAPMQDAAGSGDLVGWPFVLVRSVFIGKRQRAPGTGIVVCLGGADTRGWTAFCLSELRRLGAEKVRVIASDALAAAQGIDIIVNGWSGAERIAHAEAERMVELLSGAAVALTGASTAAVEAMALRVPLVALHWIDNQDFHARRMAAAGVAVMSDPSLAAARVVEFAHQPQVNYLDLVDGLGPVRVATAMGLQREAAV